MGNEGGIFDVGLVMNVFDTDGTFVWVVCVVVYACCQCCCLYTGSFRVAFHNLILSFRSVKTHFR